MDALSSLIHLLHMGQTGERDFREDSVTLVSDFDSDGCDTNVGN